MLLVLLVALSSAAADSWYDRGSQIFTISAGPSVPLTYTTAGGTSVGPGNGNTNFSLGGIGSIAYQIYVNPWRSFGAELGYQFNLANDGDVFTSVPILARMSMNAFQTSHFEIPVSLGFGANYIAYNGYSKLTIGTTVEVEGRWFFMDNWGIGLKTGISLIPEFYSGLSAMGESKNALLTQIPVMLTITYRS